MTRCPSMSLAPSALLQLDSACELFSKTAPGFRATKVLVSCLSWPLVTLGLHLCFSEDYASFATKGALRP